MRNYRKETAMDLARQAGHLHLIPVLERGPSRVLPDRASTTANRDRDIKQVRKQEQPADTLGPVSKQELIANVAKYKSVLPGQGGGPSGPGPAEIERMMEERQQEALAKKEEAIRARKEQERLAKIEEERIYVASLAGAGQDEKKRAAAFLAREEMRKAHEEKMREWERQRAAEEEEGRRALEELARKRERAAQGLTDEDLEAARLKEEFERKEREAVAKALASKKKQGANAVAEEEEEAPSHRSNAKPKADDFEDDDFVPPPIAGPPPSWSDDDGKDEVFEE